MVFRLQNSRSATLSLSRMNPKDISRSFAVTYSVVDSARVDCSLFLCVEKCVFLLLAWLLYSLTTSDLQWRLVVIFGRSCELYTVEFSPNEKKKTSNICTHVFDTDFCQVSCYLAKTRQTETAVLLLTSIKSNHNKGKSQGHMPPTSDHL